MIPDLSAEHRWPEWTRSTRDAGFAAVAAVPAFVDPTTAVALNLYLDLGRSWSESDDAQARVRVGAIATDVAERLASGATSFRSGVLGGLSEADRVDQAVGALMHANGCDARSAKALLEWVAARDGSHVAVVASTFIAALGSRRI